MSAPLVDIRSKPLRVLPRDDMAHARRDLYHAFDTLRVEIACCANLKEAFAIYEALKPMAQEMTRLVDVAAKRCEDIMADWGKA